MLTPKQIDYAARFWASRLKSIDDIPRFEKGLRLYLSKEGQGCTAICCKNKPESVLEHVLKKLCLPISLFETNTEMLFDVNGTVFVWENQRWQNITL